MQKNVPKYAPPWMRTVELWAETSKRTVAYALCNDRRTLLWFANQRAVEYHPTLVRADRPDHVTHLVLDLDPPDADSFTMAVRVAHLVRQALADLGLAGAVKTSGAKGVHVFVPVDDQVSREEAAAATPRDRGACRGPRSRHRHHRVHEGGPGRQGVRRLDPRRRGHRDRRVQPAGAARRAGVVPRRLGRSRRGRRRPTSPCARRWTASATTTRGRAQMPAPQRLSDALVEEGRAIPVARVQAMHEGKRRARARRT